MKALRFVYAVVVAALLSLASSQLAAQQGGNEPGTLGQLGALGQQVVDRPATPTGLTPRLPDGTVDLNGLWTGGGPVRDIEQQGGLEPGDIPLLPWAKELLDSRQADDDPHVWCLPMGVPRVAGGYPWRIVQNYTHQAPTHVFVLHEGNIHSYRQIFVDGREHPEFFDPTWFGHSIGSWDDDTFVVDTVGFNDKFWFDRRGHPHTEQLHTIERWMRVDLGHLDNEVTIDDPGAYSRPWTAKFTAVMRPNDELMEYICQENNQYGTAGGHANPY